MSPAVEEKKEAKESKTALSKKAEEILSAIETMSVLELSQLVKALEEKFGVSGQAPVVVASGAAPALTQAQPQEEKATFTVVLAQAGSQKIQVIKELRSVTSLGLKEAKDLVDGAPKTIKEGVSKKDAEAMKAKLEAVGAKVELK